MDCYAPCGYPPLFFILKLINNFEKNIVIRRYDNSKEQKRNIFAEKRHNRIPFYEKLKQKFKLNRVLEKAEFGLKFYFTPAFRDTNSTFMSNEIGYWFLFSSVSKIFQILIGDRTS